MNKGLQKLTGIDIGTAFSVLGDPNEKQKCGDETVYVWSKRSGIYYGGPTGTYVDKRRIYSSVNNDCTIRIVSDRRGIIRHCEWFGREQGCKSYADKLRDYYMQFE